MLIKKKLCNILLYANEGKFVDVNVLSKNKKSSLKGSRPTIKAFTVAKLTSCIILPKLRGIVKFK